MGWPDAVLWWIFAQEDGKCDVLFIRHMSAAAPLPPDTFQLTSGLVGNSLPPHCVNQQRMREGEGDGY